MRRRVLPGLPLALGITLVYVAIIVVLPLAALVFKAASLGPADYWRWSKPDASGAYSWRNRVPEEIVRVFEKHGFIWGGRWHHFDTMHFEYRPELLPPTVGLPLR